MNKKEIQKFDKAVAAFLKTHTKTIKSPEMRKKLKTMFSDTLLSYHVRAISNGEPNAVFDMLRIIKKGAKRNLLNKNYYTKSFFKDNIPELSKNKIFKMLLSDIYNLKQKGVGAGEVLFALLFPSVRSPTGKTGDFVLAGKHIEIKSVVSASSLKAHVNSSHRPTNRLFETIYDGHKKGSSNRQVWEGTKAQYHKFCKVVYPDFYNKKVFDRIFNKSDIKDKEQLLGYYILKQYRKIDDFDKLVVLKLNGADIEFLCINDLDDEEFIIKNLKFKPHLHRGRGTQALADGYADISFF